MRWGVEKMQRDEKIICDYHSNIGEAIRKRGKMKGVHGRGVVQCRH